jgi:hypothetical protein
MKSILYVAATLMIGASIYGFVDYRKTSRHKEFKTMYNENDLQQSVVTEEKKLFDVKPEMVSKKEQAEITTEQSPQQPIKKIKKKRTIDVESFSRAPLREKIEVVVPELKEQKVKE